MNILYLLYQHDICIGHFNTFIGRFSSLSASFRLGRSLALCFRTLEATTPAILMLFHTIDFWLSRCFGFCCFELLMFKLSVSTFNHPRHRAAASHFWVSTFKMLLLGCFDLLTFRFQFLLLTNPAVEMLILFHTFDFWLSRCFGLAVLNFQISNLQFQLLTIPAIFFL